MDFGGFGQFMSVQVPEFVADGVRWAAMTNSTIRDLDKAVPRVDGADKVTGKALYVDDLKVDGALYGRTVRSHVPHAKLKRISLDPDFDWSDVVVVTADDITGKNVVLLIEEDQPALVPEGGIIRHVDEPVALVAASDPRRAQAAMEHVRLEVEELPAVFTIEESVAKKVLLRGDDNVYKRFEILRGDDVEQALASADYVIEGTYRTGAQEQMYIEPQGMIAEWTDAGAVRLVGSLQCPYYVHKAMRELLQLDEDKVIVTQAVTGGGFGGKEEYPSMLAAHVALLAKKAKRPVRMVYDRVEDVRATTKRHPAPTRHRIGVNKDGTIVAVDVDVLIDGGAYLTLSPVVLSRGVLHSVGPYNVPHVRVVGRAMATNLPPHGAFRGFGAPQTTFAYERQIEKAAQRVGMSSLEFRRKNMLREGDVTCTGQTLKYSVGSAQVLDAVEQQIGQAPPKGSAAPPQFASVKRGKGLAFYYHGAGFTGSGEDRLKGRASVAVNAGGKFEVRSTSTDIGQGTFTIFAQLASAALDVDIKDVEMIQPSTEKAPDSGPTVASRTTMVVGSVVQKAGAQLKQRLLAFAEESGVQSGDVAELAKRYAEKHGELEETVTYHSPPGVKWDDATYRGDAYPCYGWAACYVEVAVDDDTHEVTVERCIHAVDVGHAIHPVLVKGQIEGGTLQALGWALWESVVYRNGRVANPTMTDCIIPTSIEAPEMETLVVEVPYPHGPHGAKGVGEIPMDGPAAAVANAVADALGQPFDEVPLLPEVICRQVSATAAE